ncbi:2-amino-4-hydroxy-6-hydroxymethyldihydropteridine diphosphokinase [Actinomyces faecalis]|uniref:2-amino-4-hydroxy-6- hydroxymethyldihydropteridine diphosphokinase n=1 Tax=Actinomyces faecalis TaxID=2722820 RepID=UPI001552FAD2|nr:2-amino-4-hydroxy-6-hydroxymethyldihydropteridine diphosphokinase [Actinomyces faecalis]
MSTVLTQDQIRLTGLSARGYHGVLPSEREEGQLFVVDAGLRLGARGTAAAAVTDCLDDAVDYSAVATAIIDVIEGEPVRLIETLAARVAQAVLAFEAVREVEVTVHKPQAPLEVAFEDVSVTIVRRDEDATVPHEPAGGRVDALPALAALAEPASAPVWETAEPAASSPEPAAAPSPAEELPEAPQEVQAQDALAAGLAPEPPAPADALGAGAVASAVGLAGAAGMAEAAGLLDDDGAAPDAVEVPEVAEADAPVEPEGAEPQKDREPGAEEAAPVAEAEPGDQTEPEPAPEPAPALAASPDRLAQTPEHPAEVVIALGGNVGGVVPALRQAVSTLRSTPGVSVTDVAPLARTAAVVPEGGTEQPDYLNTVVVATTTLSPRDLLAVCQGLEADAGRVRTEPKGPRTLDADLITYEGVTSTDPVLTLPHPAAAQRAFVLVPWAQADPFAEIGDQSVAALAEEAPDREGVRWLALDWLDSDHLPALPTGQYVAPPLPPQEPEVPQAPLPPAPQGEDEAAPAPEPADAPPPPAPEKPVASADEAAPRPADSLAHTEGSTTHSVPDPAPAPPAPPSACAPEPETPPVPGSPQVLTPEPAAEPEDAAAEADKEWSQPLGWDEVIGGRDGQS